MNGKNDITRVKKLKRVILRLVPGIVFLLAALTGCNLNLSGLGDTGGTDYEPPVTEIIKVLVRPATVAPGDTALFTCIVKDSTNSLLKFTWYVPVGTALTGKRIPYGYQDSAYVTDENMLLWKAPEKPNTTYAFDVTVDDHSKDSMWVDQSFSITVK